MVGLSTANVMQFKKIVKNIMFSNHVCLQMFLHDLRKFDLRENIKREWSLFKNLAILNRRVGFLSFPFELSI
jgi:hypothetical protein